MWATLGDNIPLEKLAEVADKMTDTSFSASARVSSIRVDKLKEDPGKRYKLLDDLSQKLNVWNWEIVLRSLICGRQIKKNKIS